MNRLARSTAFGIAALLVLAAGCGDDDAESASPPADSQAPAESATPADTSGSADTAGRRNRSRVST